MDEQIETNNFEEPQLKSAEELNRLCAEQMNAHFTKAKASFEQLGKTLGEKKTLEGNMDDLNGALGVINTKKLLDLDSEGINYKPDIPEEFITLSEAVSDGYLDPYYLQFFKSTHCTCGEEFIISKTLKDIHCGSLRCTSVIARAIRDLAVNFRIKGLGVVTSEEIVKTYGYKSVLDFLSHPPLDFVYDVDDLLNDEYDYVDAIRLLHLPDLNTDLNKIFKGVNSYSEYFEKVNNFGGLINFISSRIGGDVQPVKYSRILEAYDYELKNVSRILTIKQQAEKTVHIAITGELYPNMGDGAKRMTKSAYINFINKLKPNLIKFVQSNSVGSSTCCIADIKSTSAKYLEADRKHKLTTSTALVQIIASTEVFYRIFFQDSADERIAREKEEGTFRESKLTLNMLKSVGIYFFEGGNIL